MEQGSYKDLDITISGFMDSLPALTPLIRQITGEAPVIMKLELSSPEVMKVLDLARDPLMVRNDADEFGEVGLSGKAADFHRLLLGLLPVSVAINQRKLVVRGSTAKLMKVVPLFFVTPYIYPFYLESIGRSELIEQGELQPQHADVPLEGAMNKIISVAAYAAGYAIGFIKSRLSPELNVIEALESMGRGLKKGQK